MNAQNEEVGKIEDLLLDRKGCVAFVILGRGGLVGIGESFIPVPWAKLNLRKAQDGNTMLMTIHATKEQLEKAPVVKGDNYATLLARGFAKEVRHYFGVKEPEEPANGSAGEKR
jgi:hypothetical protein